MNSFWEELCGTSAFNSLGLTEVNPESLKKFDNWYLNDYYPYLLKKYINIEELKDKDVLEIGLGFGTVGEKLFLNSKTYTGLDYAKNPVIMMEYRISKTEFSSKAKSMVGDARDLPFENDSFDFVVSIGCLHHTGDVQKCIDEIYRTLKKGGLVLIMLYNKNSFRRLIFNRLNYLRLKMQNRMNYQNYLEFERSTYDQDLSGAAAPVTEYYSKKDVESLFNKYTKIKISKENFDHYRFLPRKIALRTIAKFLGLDLYIIAEK